MCVRRGIRLYEKASMGVAIANSFCQKNSMGGAVLNGPHACNT